jgi:hypothetical protein
MTQTDDSLRFWAIRACHNIHQLDRASIRGDLFYRFVDQIPIDGESPSEQMVAALEHLPNWFLELSSDRGRAGARM